MYNADELKAGLIGLMGWKQNEDSSSWQLTEMLTSETGTFYNTAHPLLTFDNLVSISKRYDDLTLVAAERDAFFTAWLKEKTEEGIITAIDIWLESKFEGRSVRNLLEDNFLFRGTGNLNNFDDRVEKFVGMEFVVNRGESITMKIREIGLQFENDQSIDILLYKSGVSAPIKTETVAYIGTGDVMWVNVSDWELKGEGAYWIGYNQASITGRSVNGATDYILGSGGVVGYPLGKYFTAKGIEVDNYAGSLWDLETTDYVVDSNYGLNFKLDVRCDFTNFILDQKDIFKRLIWLNVGIKLLEEMAWNANSNINRNESNMSKKY